MDARTLNVDAKHFVEAGGREENNIMCMLEMHIQDRNGASIESTKRLSYKVRQGSTTLR